MPRFVPKMFRNSSFCIEFRYQFLEITCGKMARVAVIVSCHCIRLVQTFYFNAFLTSTTNSVPKISTGKIFLLADSVNIEYKVKL